MTSIQNTNLGPNLPEKNTKANPSSADSELQKALSTQDDIKCMMPMPQPPVGSNLLPQFDVNKDGKLNKSEICTWGPSPLPWQDISNEIVTDDVKAYDTNHDGLINPNEAQKLISDVSKESQRILAGFDANKDGKLDKKEISTWVPAPVPWQDISNNIVTDDVKAYDTNNDGFINPDEARKLYQDEQRANPSAPTTLENG